MKSRLVVCGMIRKGRPERSLVVVLDERFCALEAGESFFRRWLKGFRPAAVSARH